ncbi:transglycosylase SLT domain-containing protein [Frigidibacter sp. MR17.24]|uniref:transglycosylase SLT domain-containing protein n=1 Tax=Frigidibacter sp. MR17.24 TaxID=3127345 RepID=UPI003012F7A5
MRAAAIALLAVMAQPVLPAAAQGWGGGLFAFPAGDAGTGDDTGDGMGDATTLAPAGVPGAAPLPAARAPASAFGGEGARPEPGNGRAGTPAYDFETDVAGEDGACLREILTAQTRYGIPNNLLLALGLQEAGFNRRSGLTVWPWSVNAAGEGRVFKSRDAALSWVRARQAAGITSIDVGCMQINQKWHPEAFTTLEEGFDPRRNVDYAARFLLSLHERTGDWLQAAGSYHSFNPGPRSVYLASLRKNLEVANARIEQFYAKAESAGLTQMMLASAETGSADWGSADWDGADRGGDGAARGRPIANVPIGSYRPNPDAPPIAVFNPLPRRPGASPARTRVAAAEPDAPFVPPTGPFWSAGISQQDAAVLADASGQNADAVAASVRRSIYSSQDLEPILPNFTPVF